MGFVTAMIEDNILKGATSTSWDIIDNINKVEIGIVKGTRTITTPNGSPVTIAELVIAFQANEKLIVIDIATSKEFEEAILAPFDEYQQLDQGGYLGTPHALQKHFRIADDPDCRKSNFWQHSCGGRILLLEETMNKSKGVQRSGIFIVILALTVLACQGASRLNPFTTATPTPTLTFTPTLTPTPTLTFTPTSTPTATPIPTGRVRREQPDGTTIFIDYDGGYQVTFPEGWTVVIYSKSEINSALESLPEQEKNVSDMIDALKSTDVNDLLRVVGFKFGAQQGAYTPNINISYDTNPLLAAISLEDLIPAMTSYFSSVDVDVVNTEVKETSSGIPIGVIETLWNINAAGGKKVNLEQKQIFFKTGEGVVVISYATAKNATIDLSADFEMLIESIELLD